MPSVNDNDLDKLFREAADRNVPEFDPQDWEDMARRLEHEERAATMRSKSLYALLFLILVNALLPPWEYNENLQSASFFETQSTEIGGIVSSEEDHNSQKEGGSNEDAITNHSSKDEEKSQGGTTENEENEPRESIWIINALRRQKEKLNSDSNKNTITKPALESIAPANSNNNKRPTSLTATVNLERTEVSKLSLESLSGGDSDNQSLAEARDFIASSNEAVESGKGGIAKDVNVIKITSVYTLPPYEQSVLSAKVTEADSIIRPVEQTGDEGQPTTVIKPDRQTPQRWFIKVPVSPDFSAIDYADVGDPGINIGLLGEYNVTAHLSISTGAIWSKKLYTSENPDKSYSSGNWTGKASMLDGDCRVLDIPINFTYYIFPDRRTNLFVSLGSSSYIMLKEQYVYTVWANQKEYQYEETFSNENNEWFSMLNLSIGIQQRLGKRFFAQAEPFLKSPMSGVGEGKVNLMSTGIFFSLKYSLNK